MGKGAYKPGDLSSKTMKVEGKNLAPQGYPLTSTYSCSHITKPQVEPDVLAHIGSASSRKQRHTANVWPSLTTQEERADLKGEHSSFVFHLFCVFTFKILDIKE